MKQIRTISRFAALLVLALSAFLLSTLQAEEKRNSAEKIKRTPVRYTSVTRGEKGIVFHTSGSLQPASTKKLSFKTGGYIQSSLDEHVKSVKKGTILARLNRSEIQAYVSKAKAALEKARRDFQRTNILYADQVITKELWENSKTALDVAKADLKIANYNLYHSTIKAPSDGRVLQKMSENGELVGAGQPIFLFGSLSNGWQVVTSLSEKEVAEICIGDSAALSFEAFPSTPFAASVHAISDAPHPRTGTYEVILSIDTPLKEFRMGYNASISLYPSRLASVQWIPSSALVKGKGKRGTVFAFTSDSTVIEKEIHIAQIGDKGFAVSSGLEGVEHIITDGSAYLKNNAFVKIVQ